jgi:hypothetical protein
MLSQLHNRVICALMHGHRAAIDAEIATQNAGNERLRGTAR